MREIKFRAWDGERLYTKVLIGNVSEPNSEDYTAHCIYRDGDWFHSDERDSIVFEQYTGLKDKNGLDIYEGDILSSDFETVPIVYCEKRAQFLMVSALGGLCIDKDKVYKCGMVVIGNIHQNPELIEAP